MQEQSMLYKLYLRLCFHRDKKKFEIGLMIYVCCRLREEAGGMSMAGGMSSWGQIALFLSP